MSTYTNYFFHNIQTSVKKELDNRAHKLSAHKREQAQLDYNTRTAFFDVYEYDPKTKKKKLILGSTVARSRSLFSGRERSNGNNQGLFLVDDQTGRLIRPKIPFAESLNIKNEGRVGSLQKATLTFSVYDKDQLSQIEPKLMKPGKDILIHYGWTNGSSVNQDIIQHDTYNEDNFNCNSDVFMGIVSNLNYSMNKDLTYGCTVELTGKGKLIGALDANASGDKKTTTEKTDSSGAVKEVTNLLDKIKADVELLNKQASKVPGWYEGTSGDITFIYGAMELKTSPKNVEYKLTKSGNKVVIDNPDNDLELPKDTKIFYLTLNDICNYFNDKIISQIKKIDGEENSKRKALLRISANPDEQKDELIIKSPVSVSLYDPHITSADPSVILFNGGRSGGNKHSANYSENQDRFSPKEGNYRIHGGSSKSAEFEWGGTIPDIERACDLGQILISTDYLSEILKESSTKETLTEKSILDLFNHIFSKIAYCSGNIYQLTFIEQQATKDRMWTCIFDKNFVHSGNKVIPYKFRVNSPDSTLVKDMRLSSKIPNAIQTALYTAGRSNLTAGLYKSADKFNEQTESPQLEEGDEEPLEVETENKDQMLDPENILKTSRSIVTDVGVIKNSINDIHNALKHYKGVGFKLKLTDKEKHRFMNNDLYPIELSITLSGITGFGFGDVITTTQLPNRYDPENFVFVVTNIEHSLSDNDWSTTLSLQCRENQNL